MRAFAFALLIACGLAACTLPGAPDDATRLETGAGERARGQAAPATSGAAAGPAPAATPPADGAGATPPARPAPPADEPAPPMSDPLPPEPLPEAAAGDASAPDRSCRTSADCVVKNVGNCCGAMPACVNSGARTDPAAVQAQCARQGLASVCGFREVTSCSCVAGTCRDGTGAVAQ